MKAIRPIVLFVCVTAWVCFVIFVIAYISHMDSNYTGQETSQSQVAYENFRSDFESAVSHSGAEINSYSVITSEPHIIVDYSVDVPYNYDFPYGVSTTHTWDWLVITVISLIMGAFIVVLPAMNMFFFKWSYKAYPMPKPKAKVE